MKVTMAVLQSPGVYVFEIPPTAAPIAGVGTSTAAFLGVGADNALAMPETPASPQTYSAGNITYTQTNPDRTVKLAGDGAKFPDISVGAPLTINGVQYVVAGATITINGVPYAVDTRAADGLSLTLKSDKTPGANITTPSSYQLSYAIRYKQVDALKPVLVTNWTEFKQSFGEIATSNQYLAQTVYGFFNNGGTRCYVVRMADAGTTNVQAALDKLAPIDEIALVAAPVPPGADNDGATALNGVQGKLLDHCTLLGDRFAILDSARTVAKLEATSDNTGIWVPGNTDGYGAFYFPWIAVDDPLTPGSTVLVPPSGHVAGVYARVDASRGVYKAPANEQLLGVRGLAYDVTKNIQNGLNVKSVNCIRSFYGTPLIWGARTMASKPEFRYVNVRRFMNFLRESIALGVRWAVFEPNNFGLWQRITRSVSDFLLGQWRDGALFGATPKEAFYVRCDATTNPSDVREQGMVVTEIGVAVVKPAEFVVFRVQQQTGS
jgi:phage tail sheath protein FI